MVRLSSHHLTVGSLFTGYGGLDQAVCAHYGAKVIWWSEIDQFAVRVAQAHYGDGNLGDVTRVDWSNVTRPDIICGGFPCQNLSRAGYGGGLDERWWAMVESLRVLHPDRVVIENVGALRDRGLDVVTHSLGQIGYVGSWTSVRASDVGACHQRDRVFLVAHPDQT